MEQTYFSLRNKTLCFFFIACLNVFFLKGNDDNGHEQDDKTLLEIYWSKTGDHILLFEVEWRNWNI